MVLFRFMVRRETARQGKKASVRHGELVTGPRETAVELRPVVHTDADEEITPYFFID